MTMRSKVHLLLPDNSLVCKNYGSNTTQDFKEATCKSCLKAIGDPKNKTWYRAIWEQFERENSWKEFQKNVVDQTLDKFPVHLNDGCKNCGSGIKTMCFVGTDYCSENCRSDLEAKEEVLV